MLRQQRVEDWTDQAIPASHFEAPPYALAGDPMQRWLPAWLIRVQSAHSGRTTSRACATSVCCGRSRD